MLRPRRTCAPPPGIPRSGTASPWARVLAIWIASRIFFLVVGAVGTALLGDADVVGAYPEPVGALGYWAHWDGRWFAHIAEHGYDSTSATVALAFFPTAFFLNAVYSDPLFLALSAGSLWAVYVRRDLLLAGLFAYFAAGTRNL